MQLLRVSFEPFHPIVFDYSNATKLDGTPTAVTTGIWEHSPVLVL